MRSFMNDVVNEPRFGREVLKLLLQVAWADHRLQLVEAKLLGDQARRFGVAPEDERELREAVAGRAALPAPDLGYLRQHREAALRAVRELIVADAHVTDEEREIVAEIETILGPT
ncbi:MAG: TerB family tellurite resistance protein [Deltaproteobacteria bacterium]|nr:TerB family tellurite resistance protein [Deltaproteobacteria bacterium]